MGLGLGLGLGLGFRVRVGVRVKAKVRVRTLRIHFMNFGSLRLVVVITDFVCRRFAEVLGCEESSLKECAKKKTLQEIIDAQIQIYPKEHVLTFCPVVDGYFLPGTGQTFDPSFSDRNISLFYNLVYMKKACYYKRFTLWN